MKRIYRILLALLSGILLSLPWLGFPGWVLFVAFVPLLILDDFFVKHKTAFPAISLWGHVFIVFLIWNVASSWWMVQASPAGVASAMLFNSFLMTLVWLLVHVIKRNYISRVGIIAFVCFWIAYEYLQFKWDMEWPCLQLGSVLVSDVKIVQWYEFTGTFGGTLWVLVLNILVYHFGNAVYKKASFRKIWLNAISWVMVLVIPIFFSLWLYYSYYEKENPRHFSIVQPNVDPYGEQYDLDAENKKLEDFIRLIKEVSTTHTDFIIGPETVFENQWFWNQDSFRSNAYLQQLKGVANDYSKAELIFGVSSFKVYTEKERITNTTQISDGVYYDRYNTALLLNCEGKVQTYHKSKLVMGVEKIPYLQFFPFFKNEFIDVGGSYGTLAKQSEASNFIAADGTKLAPVICFESVFGEYVSSFVKKGAQIIVVITNDGWWKNSRGYKQHLLFSQLRAIETRRSVARAANTGTSCFINQRGEIFNATPWWQEAAVSGKINANDKITFYVKHGDYVARMAVFFSIFLVLMIFVKRFK